MKTQQQAQYQLYIGYTDSQEEKEIVRKREFEPLIVSFFKTKLVDFSIMHAQGGFLCENGTYTIEDTLIITIIGEQGLDIMKLAKALSMYMNQECLLITKALKIISYS